MRKSPKTEGLKTITRKGPLELKDKASIFILSVAQNLSSTQVLGKLASWDSILPRAKDRSGQLTRRMWAATQGSTLHAGEAALYDQFREQRQMKGYSNQSQLEFMDQYYEVFKWEACWAAQATLLLGVGSLPKKILIVGFQRSWGSSMCLACLLLVVDGMSHPGWQQEVHQRCLCSLIGAGEWLQIGGGDRARVDGCKGAEPLQVTDVQGR